MTNMTIKKTIIGAVCALSFVASFAPATPADAAFGFGNVMPSAKSQEKHAQNLIAKETWSTLPTDTTRKLLPTARMLQKRICDANGIEITTAMFSETDDYKTKTHPIEVIDDLNNACAMGAGRLFIGAPYMRNKDHMVPGKAKYDKFQYLTCAKTIAHELAHNRGGHASWRSSLMTNWLGRNSEYKHELEAERGALKLLNNLPEGGWGAYCLGVVNHANRPEQNAKVIKGLDKEVGESFTLTGTKVNPIYNSTSGRSYEIVNNPGGVGTRDAQAVYLGGQLAECAARGALRLDNIRLAPNTLREVGFSGTGLIVCQSRALPNGQRVLLDSQISAQELAAIKKLVRTGNLPLEKYNAGYSERHGSSAYRALERAFGAQMDDTRWFTWLACAIAYDNEHRAGK